MSYDDFWFIDTRVQTRNLRRYFIWFILLFAFVTIGTIFAIRTMYHDINVYEIQSENLEIVVDEAKATNVNGYIKGNITNKSEEQIDGQYIYFLLYTDENELIGEEYIEIGSLLPNETKTYELQFRRDNVDRFVVTVTNEKLDT